MRSIYLAVFVLSLTWIIPVRAQTHDLSGEWQAPFTTGFGFKIENVRITQTGNTIQATKLTGDDWVIAGTINLKGTFNSNPFVAEQLCSGLRLQGAHWQKVTITVLDKDHFRVDGGCSGDVIWTRRHPGDFDA